ncbi:MAG: Stage sporulation protein (SpoIIE), partial [Bacteroidetes bacterium]|nr:Stage sporulation protein (SpoIIE) [Bacteroidota bacterium]
MKKVWALFVISLAFPFANAQQGSPLLTHYTESRNIENQSWAICQDENRVMYFANRKGVLVFDGVDWTTLKLPTIPYAMQINPYDGRIYIGGENKFGYIGKDKSGSYRFISLSGDSSTTGTITRIIFDGLAAWFYSEQSINRFNLQTNKLDLRLDSKPDYPFSGLFVTPENTFINVFNLGLHRLENDTLFPIVTGYLTEKTEILFSLPYNSRLVLVGLSNSTLQLFDGIKYYDYLIKDEGYLKENILSEGIALGDSAYAFSTLEGGAIVVEKSQRKVLFTINNQNELPDDEVFALGSDNTGGLWLSHQYGLTRADLKLPVANYRIFPGLIGNLSSALRYNNELYVATSEGVFFLSEVRSYDEKEILVKTRQKETPPPENIPEAAPQDVRNTRKNIFTRIFGRRTDHVKVVTDTKPSPRKMIKYTSRKDSTLKAINYLYRKVEGLNEKCRQLVSTPYGILAATNKG